MSDGAEDFRELEVDATAATADALPDIKKAVGITALKGKKAWQSAAKGHRYSGSYPASIDYDPVKVSAGDITTDVGPNLTRGVGAAGLGIVEESPGGVRGTPQRNYVAAQEVMGPDLERGVQLAIDQALRRNGL